MSEAPEILNHAKIEFRSLTRSARTQVGLSLIGRGKKRGIQEIQQRDYFFAELLQLRRAF